MRASQSIASQLAYISRAWGIAAGRAWARQFLLDLGADEYVDLEQQPFGKAVGNVDLVRDLVVGDLFRRSWAVVKPGGTLVSVVADPWAAVTARNDANSVFFVVVPNQNELGALGRRLDAGDLRPSIGGVFPLSDGRAAFEVKSHPGVPGKMVLQVI